MTPQRALDLLISVPAALLSAPIIAALAVAIRLESRGHPIYTQTRVGLEGRLFEIYKLRTMVHGAEFTGAGLAISEGDARITRLGADRAAGCARGPRDPARVARRPDLHPGAGGP